MALRDDLIARFFSHMAVTPRGRAHLLNQVADAESNGESAVFDRMLAVVDDPDLARLIRRHAADEVEHAALFAARRDAQGVDVGPAPPHLRLIDRLDRRIGFFDSPIRTRRDIMRAYLILQVIEERAITMFEVFEAGLRGVDDASADVFLRVAADEERHLRYCHAIARRYAPTPRVHAETLRNLRLEEASAYRDNSRANMEWGFEHGYTDLGPLGKLAWKSAAELSNRLGPLPTTRYWEDAPRVAMPVPLAA